MEKERINIVVADIGKAIAHYPGALEDIIETCRKSLASKAGISNEDFRRILSRKGGHLTRISSELEIRCGSTEIFARSLLQAALIDRIGRIKQLAEDFPELTVDQNSPEILNRSYEEIGKAVLSDAELGRTILSGPKQ